MTNEIKNLSIGKKINVNLESQCLIIKFTLFTEHLPEGPQLFENYPDNRSGPIFAANKSAVFNDEISVCFKFNGKKCIMKNCKFRHVCRACGGSHAIKFCENVNTTLMSKREGLTVSTNLVGIAKSFLYPLTPKIAQFLKSKDFFFIKRWENELKLHFDKTYAKIILRIIEIKVKIGYQNPKTQILSKNLTSANENFIILTKNLKKQFYHDKVIKLKNFGKYFIFFSLGLTPKIDERGRRIHHLSHFKGRSVNCNIFKKGKALKYSSVDEAMKKFLKIGLEAILMKKDLFEVFRHVSVAEKNGGFLNFQGESEY